MLEIIKTRMAELTTEAEATEQELNQAQEVIARNSVRLQQIRGAYTELHKLINPPKKEEEPEKQDDE